MKCAIVYRGICRGKNLHPQTNTVQYIDYKKCLISVKNNIIKNNTDTAFDVYCHGWVDDLNIQDNLNKIYRTKNSLFEEQINFEKYFLGIKNYKQILQERYKHLHHNKGLDFYSNIYFQNYFQSIFSYAFSISKSVSFIEENDYDYIIFLRYDCWVNEKITLSDLDKTKFYTDNVGRDHSPLFYGDFLAVSDNKIKIFSNFFNFVNTSIFNNKDFADWVNDIKENKKSFNPYGRYEHGIYSNQVLYAYFLAKSGKKYNDIIPKYNCQLIKQL